MKFLLFAQMMLVAGCQSGPPPRIYVLSPPAAAGDFSGADNRPVIELRTVSVPDYLDTRDIVLRDGRNALSVSTGGRWGERLSIGIAQGLRAELAARVKSVAVVQAALPGQAARRLYVDVEAFDITPDQRCVLTARWAFLRDDRQTAGRGTVITTVLGGVTDAAVVSAMTDAVGLLADRIKVTIMR